MRTANEKTVSEMLLADNFGSFCRWLAEIWSTRGVDIIVEMLEKPHNWIAEWNEFNELCTILVKREQMNAGGVPCITMEEFMEESLD